MAPRRLGMLLILFSSLCTSFPASSQVQVGFTVGIDKGTQDFIERLLPEVRRQLLELLRAALPEIDKSVLTYLKRADEIIQSNVDSGLKAVQCTAAGTGALAKDSMHAYLTSLFFEKISDKDLTFSNVANPLQELSRSIPSMRAQITTKTEVNQILAAYSDLLLHVAIVNCETRFTDSLPIALETQAYRDSIYVPAIEWHTLIGPSKDSPWCKTPLECVKKRREQVVAFIKANPADADFSTQKDRFNAQKELGNAQKEFDRLTPDAETSFLDPLFPRSIRIVDYEQLLARYRQIERAVTAHKASRKEAASKLLQEAKAQTADAVSLVKNLGDNFRKPSDFVEDRANVIKRYPEMVQKTANASATTKRAMAKDSDLNEECKKLEIELAQNVIKAGKLKKEADASVRESNENASMNRPPRKQYQ